MNTKKLWIALLLTGIGGGLGGILLTEVMHTVQHLAYGYGSDGIYIPFRVGVEHASPWRRLIVLMICGLLAGWGWWLLSSKGKPLVSIKNALKNPLQGLPFVETVSHVFLQIITVALGSPLGREVAPREMSAALASVWVRRLGLNEDEARLLIACASGAGLAAVYNVPLASTIFVLETMLGIWTQQALIAALLTSVLATAVARVGLGDEVQYPIDHLTVNTALLWWAVLIGPVLGAAAVYFQRLVKHFPLLKRDDRKNIKVALIAFTAIGVMAMFVPEILGNGKAGNQMTFGNMISWHGSVELLVFKLLAVSLALAAGAYGGLITPSMMMGSTLAFTVAALWNMVLPSMPSESAAVVGAAVFLGVSQSMPITAIVFILELTRGQAGLLMPLCIGMAGAVIMKRILEIKE